jgi:hypothetical protein
MALAILAAVAAAAVFVLLGDALQTRRAAAGLSRLAAANARAMAVFLPEGGAAAWEAAAEATDRLGAELAALDPLGRSAAHAALLEFLHRQAAFLRAGGQLDRMAARARAAGESFRAHLWHPPEQTTGWPLYLDQAQDLQAAFDRARGALEDAAAAARASHAGLLEAQAQAAARLAAAGIRLEDDCAHAAERLQPVLAAAGEGLPGF